MSKYIVEIDNPLPGAMKPPDMARDGKPVLGIREDMEDFGSHI